MNRFLRLLKHRAFDETDARRALGPEALRRIASRVEESEKHHTGEIRVCVESGLPVSYVWRGATARERAVAMFGKLRVWDTEQNNGVLIYLLLAEHRIEIVADRGLNAKVAPERWTQIVDDMAANFRQGRFEEGLEHAVDTVDRLLREHFATDGGRENPNELPDHPHVM